MNQDRSVPDIRIRSERGLRGCVDNERQDTAVVAISVSLPFVRMNVRALLFLQAQHRNQAQHGQI
ncbi:hypothetical protein EOS_36280 [Caballeronia mineralivorans PML1(12)]|uniref:Uncharacterized protein n=1 Tax=Caballeronia mineralivorans PML1(12) TaxID=908627 RepID=A0A0J1FNV3_9BURK|nr:hypothetical protein EOS_36280 [Caballeronia mineralivorans PML1(12)]